MKEFEYKGDWWLPDSPTERISGILKFNSIDGAYLELMGSFREYRNLTTALDIDIISGYADGKIITLYKCQESNSTSNITGGMPVSVQTSFIVNVVFVGHHFNKEEDIVFNSLSVNYSQLENWINISGFKVNVINNKNDHFEKYELSYNLPKELKIKLDDIELFFDYTFNAKTDLTKKVELYQTVFMKMQPTKQLHFKDYTEKICCHIQNFLSLMIGTAIYPMEIKGIINSGKIGEKQKSRDINVLIFYRLGIILDKLKELNPYNMLFSYNDIASDFERYLKNWFSKAELLKPVYGLYFATLYSSSIMYLHHEFLSLTQAIESYHRRIYGGKYISNNECKPIYKVLCEAIPHKIDEDFKESIQQRLKYLSEFSLRKRLKDILDKHNNILNKVIPDQDVFIEDVTNTRNFLVHYNKSIEAKAKTKSGLYKLTKQLKFLLEVCFLTELEIPEINIKRAYKKK